MASQGGADEGNNTNNRRTTKAHDTTDANDTTNEGRDLEVEQPWEDHRLDERLRPLMQYFASRHASRSFSIDEVKLSYEQLRKRANRNTGVLDAMEEFLMQSRDIYEAAAPTEATTRVDGDFTSVMGGNVVRYVSRCGFVWEYDPRQLS